MYNCRPILRTEILENIGLIKLLLFYRAALCAHGHECCHLTVACAVLYKRLMYVVHGPSSFELVPLQWSCLLYEPTLDNSVQNCETCAVQSRRMMKILYYVTTENIQRH